MKYSPTTKVIQQAWKDAVKKEVKMMGYSMYPKEWDNPLGKQDLKWIRKYLKDCDDFDNSFVDERYDILVGIMRLKFDGDLE
jgi:hypothetical protein